MRRLCWSIFGLACVSAPVAADGPAALPVAPNSAPVPHPVAAVASIPVPSTDAANVLCAPACCTTGCGPAGRCWVDSSFLYWFASGNPTPPLITSAPTTNPVTDPARLGGNGTRIISGGSRFNNDLRGGFRITAGTWLNCDQTCGLEGDFFFLGQSRQAAVDGGDGSVGSTIISRPFFNVVTGQQDAELVSFPNRLAGQVSVSSRNDVIGGGVNGIWNCCCTPCSRLDVLLGYRYLGFTDETIIREDLTSLAGAANVPVGSRFQIEDRFHVQNSFHGVNLGVRGEKRFGDCYLGYSAAVALGVNHIVTDISGFTIITAPPGQTGSGQFPGGLLTQRTNIGRSTRNEFAAMPEVGLRAGCQLTEHVRAYIGYTFIYLSRVQRSGDAIDLSVNPSQIAPSGGLVGPAAPIFTPRYTDFWLQGVSIGVEGRF